MILDEVHYLAFAAEDGSPEECQVNALGEMKAKCSDYVVVNTPSAMAAEASRACILSAAGVLLPWDKRPKADLAKEIVNLLAGAK